MNKIRHEYFRKEDKKWNLLEANNDTTSFSLVVSCYVVQCLSLHFCSIYVPFIVLADSSKFNFWLPLMIEKFTILYQLEWMRGYLILWTNRNGRMFSLHSHPPGLNQKKYYCFGVKWKLIFGVIILQTDCKISFWKSDHEPLRIW